MFNQEFLDSSLFNWLVLPFLIFFARTCDVTLGTLRNIFLSKNIKYIVPLLGFFEVLIWLVAISQIMKNLHNIACYLGWAFGYSMGIYVGIKIEERLALGLQVIRVITNQDCHDLIEAFKIEKMGVTIIDGHGAQGPVKILFTIIKRKDKAYAVHLINRHNPNAFFSVEDIRNVSQGVFRGGSSESKIEEFRKMFEVRK
jgi:uncharacterized protein YebE (UPF0316 family)